MIVTQVIPHQLCSCCAAFVRQADCLKKTTQELLPSSYDRETDDDPIINIHSTYPTIQYIMASGNRGCHLCSMLTITLEKFSKLASEQAEDKPIYTSLTLYPYYSNSVAAFCLTLHRGYPSRRRWPPDDNAKRACLIRRSENELIVGCEDCDKCVNAQQHCVSAIWRSQSPKWFHARWTNHTASDLSFKMISGWLNECLRQHPKCASEPGYQSPTRVLDINSLKHKHSVRLVLGTQLGLGVTPYAALSYRWGECKDFTLTRQNITTFQQGVPLSSFPKTFLEAVYVCQQLGIHFLWS